MIHAGDDRLRIDQHRQRRIRQEIEARRERERNAIGTPMIRPPKKPAKSRNHGCTSRAGTSVFHAQTAANERDNRSERRPDGAARPARARWPRKADITKLPITTGEHDDVRQPERRRLTPRIDEEANRRDEQRQRDDDDDPGRADCTRPPARRQQSAEAVDADVALAPEDRRARRRTPASPSGAGDFFRPVDRVVQEVAIDHRQKTTTTSTARITPATYSRLRSSGQAAPPGGAGRRNRNRILRPSPIPASGAYAAAPPVRSRFLSDFNRARRRSRRTAAW